MAKSIMVTEKAYVFSVASTVIPRAPCIRGQRAQKLSEKYGLKVYLCPWCHRLAKDSVHQSAEKAIALKAQVQIRAMAVYRMDGRPFPRVIQKELYMKKGDAVAE